MTSTLKSLSACRVSAILQARASLIARLMDERIAFSSRRATGGGTVTVMTDVTEQERAEEARLRSERRLVDAIETISEEVRLLRTRRTG